MAKLTSIRKACKITDLIFSEIVRNFIVFKTEKDVETFFNKECKKHMVKRAFKPVIAIGRNAYQIHHAASGIKLKRGFCVIDMGVKVDGFCSDMTRTISIGEPSKEEKNLYNLVVACQKKTSNKLRPGANCADIDIYARTLLGKYKKFCLHGLGHGVGKKIHEKPSFKPTSQDIILAGDVVTIEPGIYLKGELGIRIEDTILIKKNGIEVLTKSTKRLIKI